jgi:hypothetical protein
MNDWLSWVGALSILASSACTQTGFPIHLDANYARVAIGVAGQQFEAPGQESSFPLPLAEATLGRLVLSDDTMATSIELGGQIFDIDPGGDLKGTGYRILGGLKQTFQMDQRLMPHISGGGSWMITAFQDHSGDFDSRGPGAYLGAGLTYMLTPAWGIGLDGRFHVIYSEAKKDNDVVTGLEGMLHLMYRF